MDRDLDESFFVADNPPFRFLSSYYWSIAMNYNKEDVDMQYCLLCHIMNENDVPGNPIDWSMTVEFPSEDTLHVTFTHTFETFPDAKFIFYREWDWNM